VSPPRSAELEPGELERQRQDSSNSRPESSSAAAEIRRAPQWRQAGRRREGRIGAGEEGLSLEEEPGRRGRRPRVRQRGAGRVKICSSSRNKIIEGSRDKIFM